MWFVLFLLLVYNLTHVCFYKWNSIKNLLWSPGILTVMISRDLQIPCIQDGSLWFSQRNFSKNLVRRTSQKVFFLLYFLCFFFSFFQNQNYISLKKKYYFHMKIIYFKFLLMSFLSFSLSFFIIIIIFMLNIFFLSFSSFFDSNVSLRRVSWGCTPQVLRG